MSEDTNINQPDETTPDQPSEEAAQAQDPADESTEEPTEEPTGGAAPRRGFRERLAGVRGLIAVGAATLVLGGLGGYAVGAVTSDGDHGRDHERHDRPFDDAGREPARPPSD